MYSLVLCNICKSSMFYVQPVCIHGSYTREFCIIIVTRYYIVVGRFSSAISRGVTLVVNICGNVIH